MAREKEEDVVTIRPGDYIEELEQKVKLELDRIYKLGVPEKRTSKYKYTERPTFDNEKAQLDWEMEEIHRCIHGYQGIPPAYYYYLNHTYIKHKKRGKIRPDFRTMDLEWFKFLDRVDNERPKKGIVCIKRRQVGMSWKASLSMLHKAQFNRDYEIGMNSKTETDSWSLFEKVKYLYRNQSDFLRAVTSTDRRDAMFFAEYGKDQFGNRIIKKGTQSRIISCAPVDTAHIGNSYQMLVMDEIGETENAETIWSNAEDCITQDGERTGIFLGFGTMGQTDKAGRALKEFWLNHKSYDFEQFAFWGYNELIMDGFGNDNLEESVRFIIYRRKKLEAASKKVYEKFLQKYPLNEADAFLAVGGGGVGNPLIIAQQEVNLAHNPPEARQGRFKLIGETPHFEPNPNGPAIIYELPQTIKNGYRAVLDPAEDDDVKKSRDSSDLGFTIAARPYGLLPIRLAVEICYRPPKLEEAYVQFAIACRMYGCKITIEMNKGGWRAYKWFETNHPDLLELAPKSATSARGGVEMKYGVKMTPERKSQMEGLLEEDIDNNCLPDPVSGHKGMPSKKMLAQYKVLGSDHEDDDLAVSWGWQLILNQADKRVAKSYEAPPVERSHLERIGNRMVLVNGQGKPLIKSTLPKNPLFRTF